MTTSNIQTKKEVTVNCPFCHLSDNETVVESRLNIVIETQDPVLVGSVMIVPRAHRETPFDLTPEEWADTFALLHQIRTTLDDRYHPDGYNLGWNCGETAGQEVFHAHLHVIPRFRDEPMAGKGIRYHLKQRTAQGEYS